MNYLPGQQFTMSPYLSNANLLTDEEVNAYLAQIKEMDFRLRELGFFPGHPKIMTFLENNY